jgi:hypothetical protein
VKKRLNFARIRKRASFVCFAAWKIVEHCTNSLPSIDVLNNFRIEYRWRERERERGSLLFVSSCWRWCRQA